MPAPGVEPPEVETQPVEPELAPPEHERPLEAEVHVEPELPVAAELPETFEVPPELPVEPEVMTEPPEPAPTPAHEPEPPVEEPLPEQAIPAELPAEQPAPVRPAPIIIGRTGPRTPVVQVRSARSRRAPVARLAALVALAAVIVAAVLVVKALHGESKPASPRAPVVVKVVIPEGETRAQIALIAKKEGLGGSYRIASRKSALLDPAHYGAPHGTPDLEGFLFPATYDMDAHAQAAQLVEKQLVAFRENFGVSEIERAHALHVTPYQLLTVASMVEREAQVPSDRAKIAAVIYNRLRENMPLGIDASIYYAVELEKGVATYTHELTESELRIDSPYNTRTHTGLPPTPISNPGAASIQAAAHPAHVSYLYYVAGADGCGEQVFSTSQASFEKNVAAYQAALQKNGGHPPSCKHK